MRAYLLWTFPASERRVSFSTKVQSPCLPLLQDSGNDDKERTYFTLPMQPQGTTIMVMSDALCSSSISYSPFSFITSRTLTTAPPFRTSPEEMAAVWADGREGGRGVCVVAYSVAPTAPAAYHSALYRTSELVYFEFRMWIYYTPRVDSARIPKTPANRNFHLPSRSIIAADFL